MGSTPSTGGEDSTLDPTVSDSVPCTSVTESSSSPSSPTVAVSKSTGFVTQEEFTLMHSKLDALSTFLLGLRPLLTPQSQTCVSPPDAFALGTRFPSVGGRVLGSCLAESIHPPASLASFAAGSTLVRPSAATSQGFQASLPAFGCAAVAGPPAGRPRSARGSARGCRCTHGCTGWLCECSIYSG